MTKKKATSATLGRDTLRQALHDAHRAGQSRGVQIGTDSTRLADEYADSVLDSVMSGAEAPPAVGEPPGEVGRHE